MVIGLALMGCGPGPEPVVEEEAGPVPVADAVEVLVRASLDVRGVRPAPEELDAVAADPSLLGGMLDAMVDDPGFGPQLKSMFAPAFRTRIDVYPFYGDELSSNDEIGEEPLDLLLAIVQDDRPYTDLLLADYTVVSEGLLERWPLEAVDDGPPAPEGTVVARYTDGRPHAGVLTTNSLWWRHPSTLENANRGRANMLSTALLCESYLDRPIDFPRDVDLSDSETIRRAINQEPACTACHATLDPLGSYLWGFMYVTASADAWATYRPEGERDWLLYTGRPPGFFGEPGSTMVDLGIQIASDPRFVSCGVKRVYEDLLGRRATLADDGALAEHRDAFILSGLSVKALVRSVLSDPRYQGLDVPSEYGGRPEPIELKVITPDRLGSDLEALTGYRMGYTGRDALRLDYGLRSVAGGSDKGAATLPSTGLALVNRRLAEAASVALVDGAAEGGALADLIDDFDAEPSAELVAELVLVATSEVRAVDAPEVTLLTGLWQDVAATTDARTAWKAMLTALLSDPVRLVY